MCIKNKTNIKYLIEFKQFCIPSVINLRSFKQVNSDWLHLFNDLIYIALPYNKYNILIPLIIIFKLDLFSDIKFKLSFDLNAYSFDIIIIFYLFLSNDIDFIYYNSIK